MNRRIIGMCLALAALVAIAGCKKKKDDDVKPKDEPVTEGLTVLRKESGGSDGTLKWLSVKRFSVSADGNMHALYEKGNSFGPAELIRRTYSSKGDSIGAPAIPEYIRNIASNNDVNDNWFFVPNTGNLTLAYHPASSYSWGIYNVETGVIIRSVTDASFGTTLRPAYDGTYIGSGGFGGYTTNANTMISQAVFHYLYGPVGYKRWGDLHVVTDQPEGEDQQRRVFIAEPADNGHIAVCYMDAAYIYVKYYDISTETVTGVDSFATNALQHLTRRIAADATIRTRTTANGQKIVYMVKYLKDMATNDVWKYSTFIFDKTTRKISQVVSGHVVSASSVVEVDDNGYLLYCLTDNNAQPATNIVYKVMADGAATKIASVKAGTGMGNTIVTGVQECMGKVYVFGAMQASSTTTQGPRSYIMVVK